jgi:hypothetical protein
MLVFYKLNLIFNLKLILGPWESNIFAKVKLFYGFISFHSDQIECNNALKLVLTQIYTCTKDMVSSVTRLNNLMINRENRVDKFHKKYFYTNLGFVAGHHWCRSATK